MKAVNEQRVVCGGSWAYFPRFPRSVYHNGNNPDVALYNVGFRVMKKTASADRTLRGGCWIIVARLCRSAQRILREPGDRSVSRGFRVMKRI